jgi:hypothetical protein
MGNPALQARKLEEEYKSFRVQFVLLLDYCKVYKFNFKDT